MAKISKTKEYAIKYLFDHAKKSVKDISTELKVSVSDVERIVGTKPKTAKAKTDKTKDLMIRQTSAKKMNTVSIMTEAAAQLSDEFIKNIEAANKARTSKYIFRPKD
jgi:hypothetical protein